MKVGLMAFDPAKQGAAWARFHDARLVSCGLSHHADLCTAIGGLPLLGGLATYAWSILIEVPQVYQQRGWKGDPNDLIDVAVTVGMIARHYWEDPHRLVQPHTWKGSVPKGIMTRRIVASLDVPERSVIDGCGVRSSLAHNVVDAVGLGLWGLGRLGK